MDGGKNINKEDPCKTCNNYPCNYITASICGDLVEWQKQQEKGG